MLFHILYIFHSSMGCDTDLVETKLFTRDHLTDRSLILTMLKWEDQLILSDLGQSIYRNKFNKLLQPQFVIQRMVLTHFGFDTSDNSLSNYREIFRTYYKSPVEYDHEVLDSVVYMRENRCVYYTEPMINVSDKLPHCSLFGLDGHTKYSLHEIIDRSGYQHCLIAAFSTS